MGWDKPPSEFSKVVDKDVEKAAGEILNDILGDEVSLIESISFSKAEGKFHSVEAPDEILDKLREADLLMP